MTLGQHLKNKRVELGRSLEQISAMTRIHVKILTALEEDQYSELPAKAFTRGFIVNYAKALKLNSESLLRDYHDFLEAKFAERPTRDQGHQGYAFEGKELEQNRRWMGIGLGVAGVFALAVVIVFKPGNHKRKEKHKDFVTESAEVQMKEDNSGEQPMPVESPSTSNSSSAPLQEATLKAIGSSTPSSTFRPPFAMSTPAPATPTPTPSVAPTAAPQATPTPAPSVAPTPAPEGTPADKLNKGDDLTGSEAKLKITLTAKEDAYIRYRSDERPAGALILRQGKSIVIKAKDRILFQSNPSAHFQYRTRKMGSTDLESNAFEMLQDGKITPYSGTELGATPPSDTIPQPRSP